MSLYSSHLEMYPLSLHIAIGQFQCHTLEIAMQSHALIIKHWHMNNNSTTNHLSITVIDKSYRLLYI